MRNKIAIFTATILRKVRKILRYIVYLCLIHMYYVSSVIASDYSSTNFFRFEGLPCSIKEITEIYNLKIFDLDKENKLYTNADERINFVSIVNKIILAQDNLFIFKSKPYNIILIDDPNLNDIEGIAKEDYIIVKGDINKDIKEYNRVISHELAHRYIGHTIKQDTDKKNEIKYKWFFEGFTEFYGVKTLLNAELIDIDEYLTIINSTIKEYFNSIINNINFEKISEKHLLDKNIRMLSYYKGFILAVIINEKLNEVSNNKYNLLDLVNEIIDEINSNHIRFDTDLFSCYLKSQLSESFVKKIIDSINNPNILLTLLPNTLLNKNLTFQDIDKHSEICFNIIKTLETQKIKGVKPGSNCYNSGLRDGQQLKCYSMYFNNGYIKLKVLEKEVIKTVHLEAKKIISRIPIYK
ncbi:M61 family metallopeptidase [Wolbachia endosymbiont of Pentidionis agamae]|uniref:M61 family metallopeptidase n=1 Tax=Wolbachia endosymbiont of Pentidionis agamae TaxID=3110435 RepID=UPI002FCE9285